MPRNREQSPNGYTPLEEILRDKERDSRIGSAATEYTPLHDILSDVPARRPRTAPLSPPDPRDSDPLHTPLIVAPRDHWNDNVRSQYTGQLDKLYDAHRNDDGPTAAQIQAVRDWGSDLADREATGARFSAHGWALGPWRDYSVHNYPYGAKDYSSLTKGYPGPVISNDHSYNLPYAQRFTDYMDRYERGPIEAYATYRDPNGDHPFARAADGTILGLGTGAISGGGRSGNVASPSYRPSIGLNQRYALNDGFITSSPTELPRGYRFLRTGDEDGKLIRPIGTSADAVSMPPWQKGPTNSYEVVQPFTVDMGRAAPYYGKRGFGTQGKTKDSIEDLRLNRYIKKYP